MEISALNKSLTDEYLEILKLRRYSQNTIRNYRSAYAALNSFLENQVLHQDLVQNDIIMFLETISHEADSTFNSRLSALKSFFNYLVDIGARIDNPIKKQMYRRLHWREPRALEEFEIQRYLDLMESARNDQILAIKIMHKAGLRLSEVINLDIKKDIEHRENGSFIHIRRSKNKFPRVVPIFSVSLSQELKEIQKLYFDIKSYNLNINKNNFLHWTRKYKKLYNSTITPHMLRHTFATERFEEGMDINTIRILLGHKSINMTLLYIANRLDIYKLLA